MRTNFFDYVLEKPAYGWKNEQNELAVPTKTQLFSEFFSRLNVIRDKKNWISFISWFWILSALAFPIVFFIKFFTWPLAIVGFLYGMVILGTHGTVWYHRYCTHGAFKFKNNFWKGFTRNLGIKLFPEETYVVSHHVHHLKSELPGDPYNPHAGALYCFLADVNHQKIATNLNEKDYGRLTNLLRHTGFKMNSFSAYEKWGSVACPVRTTVHWLLNWTLWYGVFFLIGGHALAFALFSGAFVWGLGIRTFNYEGHGKGKDLKKEGVDFHQTDNSINQVWPGLVAGEWHNNHHLYPHSARSGFTTFQLDFAWYYIWLLQKLGAVTAVKNSKNDFFKDHFLPNENSLKRKE
ncbi:MAG: fatty-acid desaturase [Cyclobacteriaceae bacterium]|jgi:fatty-acid desaturase